MNSFLTLAANGTRHELQVCLEAGEDLNVQDKDGNSPLHVAVLNENLAAVRFFISAAADLSATNRWHQTPVELAADGASKPVVEALIAANAPYDPAAALHYAASWADPQDKIDILKLFLPLHKDKINVRNHNGLSVLHAAAMANYSESVELLLDCGADLNPRDQGRGVTPLHAAILADATECVQLLLERGADPNTRDNFDNSPLSDALRRGNEPLVSLLLAHGASPAHLSFQMRASKLPDTNGRGSTGRN